MSFSNDPISGLPLFNGTPTGDAGIALELRATILNALMQAIHLDSGNLSVSVPLIAAGGVTAASMIQTAVDTVAAVSLDATTGFETASIQINNATSGAGGVYIYNDGTKIRVNSTVPSTAPADASLSASQVSAWVDEIGNTLSFKVKYSDGTTVKSGSIALT